MRAELLLVEDEPDLVEPLLFALRQDGHDVSMVTTGEAALQCVLGDSPPALVLLDVVMESDDAGLHAVRAAERAGVGVTLLDASPEHSFATRLAAVAGGTAPEAAPETAPETVASHSKRSRLISSGRIATDSHPSRLAT